MSDIKEKLTAQVEKINETITDAKEKAIVMDAVQNMINVFTEHVVKLTERQVEVESRVEEILDMLSSIEDEMIESFADDLQAECPYCKELIPLRFPDDESTDFECPHCHNVIELELMLDGEHEGCGCGCDDCHDCDDDCDCGCEDCDCEDEEE